MSATSTARELSIDLGDGVTLHTYGDEHALAEKWAQYLHGQQIWSVLSDGAQHIETDTMLRVLHDLDDQAREGDQG